MVNLYLYYHLLIILVVIVVGLFCFSEIIERIEKNHEPIRPNVDVLNCDQYLIDCMKICWSEYPEMRPDFRSVWRMLKPMRHGT